MNLPLFIAKRINSSKENRSGISRPIISIAIIGIALGLTVMILSVAIVTGFKKEIRRKVIGFGAHLQILNFDSNKSYETHPIEKNKGYYPFIKTLHGVKHIQVFATKAGIIKTEDNIQGVVLKGVSSDFDWSFFKEHITEGDIFSISNSVTTNDILISRYIASLLKLKLGDPVIIYFIQQPPRMRKFVIKGIYDTNLEEMDKLFILCDIKHIQRLNQWDANHISGFEIMINNFENLDNMYYEISNLVGYDFFDNGSKLRVLSIREKYPQIFDWLNLLDVNVWIILILMLAVAGVNMVSGLLILILERTNMIGILKALGASNSIVRKIFIYQSVFLISRGLITGNVIALIVCFVQKYFNVIKLDPSSYYISSVPININLLHILLLNIGTLAITLFMLLVPSLIISNISPDKTIRFN